MIQTQRYPGSRPFHDTPIERLLFRGRAREKDELLHLILAHDHVLLYARSGTGKTSLLNAGVLEELRVRDYFPSVVRLNSVTPIDTIREIVLDTAHTRGLEIKGLENTSHNLVFLLSKARFWRDNTLLTPVMILDQFEELFTLHEAHAQETIIAALSDLAARRLPSELDERFGHLKTMPYKLVFSVREDYLGEMESVASKIPTVMHHRFRLTPLRGEQARQAIREPAAMMDETLRGPAFTYTDEAVDEMVSFLSRRRERDGYRQGDEVEPFQLQILCRHIENDLVPRAPGDGTQAVGVVIDKKDLGGTERMDRILEQHYNDQIERLAEEIREPVHDFCENGLISPTGKRLSLEEDDIQARFGVGRDVLTQLVDFRLLRAEPRVGSTYYELSHDSLVAAVERTGSARRPQALLNRARRAREHGNFMVATQHYVELLNISPEDWIGYAELSSLLIEQERLDDAAAVLDGARAGGIEHLSIFFNRGRLLLAKGEVAEAIAELEKAVNIDRRFLPGHLLLGNAFGRVNRGLDAENCYREALALEPDNPDVHAQLLTLFLNRRQFNRLEEQIEKIRDKDWFLDLLGSLIEGLWSSGARELACKTLRQAMERRQPSFESMIRVADAADRFDAALAAAAFERAAEFNPEARIHGRWGVALNQLGRSQEAVDVLTKALEQNPNDVDALVTRAWALTNLQRNDEAIEDCKRAIALKADPTKPLMYWGRNLSYQDKQEDAIEKFEAALVTDPDNSEILAMSAASLFRLSRYDEAIEKARLAIRADLSNDYAYFQLALALWVSKRLNEADEMFKTACELNSESPVMLVSWGEVLSEMERHNDAIEKFRRAHHLDKMNPRALAGWGECLRNLGRYQESIAMFQQALELDDAAADVHMHLAQSLVEIRKTGAAMAHFERASSLAPQDAWIHHAWAEALIGTKQYVAAEEKFRRAAECTADRTELGSIYVAWGDSLGKLGRYSEGEEKYRKALEIDRGNIDWLAGLGISIAYQGRSDEARELLLEAERLGPTTESELGNVGWGFYQLGEYEKSLSYSRRAVALQPDTFYSRCNVGLALLHLGRPDEAEKEYDHAVEIAERRALTGEEFAYHATDDIENALKKTPDLAGARAVLKSLREHEARLRDLRERSM